MGIGFCVWEQFLFKASGSRLAYVAQQIKSLCLLVNNLDTPSYHLSVNDSEEMEHVKSEMIRDKENNRGRLSHKKNKQDDAISAFLPPSSSHQEKRLLVCDSISEFQHSSSQEPQNSAILGADLLPTWGQAHLFVPGVCETPHG